MDDYVKKIVKRGHLLFLLSRKMLDATIEGQDVLLYKLIDDYKRVSEGLEEVVYSKDKVDYKKLSLLIDKKCTSLYGESSPIPECCNSLVYNLLEKRTVGDKVFNKGKCLLEDLLNIEYTLMVEHYKNLNDTEKDHMFNYLACCTMHSISIQEVYKGDFEKADYLSNPDNFFKGINVNLVLEPLLKENLYSRYMEIKSLETVEALSILTRDPERINQANTILNVSYLNEKISIAAIYVVARKRNLNVALEDFEYSDKCLEIIKEAAEMGEDYLNRFVGGFQKTRGQNKRGN